MENLRAFSLKTLFVSLTSLRKARQGISNSISLSPTIIDLKVVLRELLGLMDQAGVQVLYIHESTKVTMVNKNKNLIFATF